MQTFLTMLLSALLAARMVEAHAAFWHPSMWGFNVTSNTFAYDNRPVVPLKYMNFTTWWFHGHLDYPPNDGDFFELPAGKAATAEIACTKGATSFADTNAATGGDVREKSNPNDVCPGMKMIEYHTTGVDNVKGCALSIAYKSDVANVTQEDFTVFSVNQTCVWTRFTDFQVPEKMPACPPGGCICAWHWIHSIEGGGEENYMNGFRCNVTGATSDVALAKPAVPRRCGADLQNNRASSVLGNCTYGAKQPIWWLNNQSTLFEAPTAPPFYNDLYNFRDGPQDDIFADTYVQLPEPSPTAQLPVLRYAVKALSGVLSIAQDLGNQATSAFGDATSALGSIGNQATSAVGGALSSLLSPATATGQASSATQTKAAATTSAATQASAAPHTSAAANTAATTSAAPTTSAAAATTSAAHSSAAPSSSDFYEPAGGNFSEAGDASSASSSAAASPSGAANTTVNAAVANVADDHSSTAKCRRMKRRSRLARHPLLQGTAITV
ncbi:hypothetical protein EV121DRAFT_263730 [Schizophyllum commune]